MLERYAICVKLSAEKKQCQLIYIGDPLAMECRPIPKAVEQNIKIGYWLKVQFNAAANRKTWELTEDGPFLTSITAEGKILITIPIFFPPCLSSLAPYLDIPNQGGTTLYYFHVPLTEEDGWCWPTGDGQIQGEWKKPDRKVKKNHIYNGKFEIELENNMGTPKWTLIEIYDQWEDINERISPNSALFLNGTCQQGRILKINGNLAIILGEHEKLVYAELEEEPNWECAVGDFIEYKQMNITFNGSSVPIGIKCNGQHCQLDSCRKNLLKKMCKHRDYFQIRLDAANWGQLFEPATNRIKGIGTLTCLPQHSSQLSSPKMLPIFVKVQALFYFEFHSVLWTVLEITDNEQIEEANTAAKKCAEKVPEDIDNDSNLTGFNKLPPSLNIGFEQSISRSKISSPSDELSKKCGKSANHPIDAVPRDCPHFFQHGWCAYKENCKFSHGHGKETRGFMKAVKKSVQNKAKALATIASTNGNGREANTINWAIGKNAVFLCKKGNEAILMEFKCKLVTTLFEIKAASMPKDVGVGECVQMDYQISAKCSDSARRRTLTAVRNVKKMDGQFIRTRVAVGGWAEIFTEFYECTDKAKNEYRTSRGLLFLPNALNAQSGGDGHFFWCRFSDMQVGKVTHFEKVK